MKIFSNKNTVLCFVACFFFCSHSLAAWKFGNYDGHRNYKLTLPDSENNVPVTFSISGRGWGEVNEADFSLINLYDTNESTILRINAPGKDPGTIIGNIVADGNMYAILAKKIDLQGVIQVKGMLARLQLDDIYDSQIFIGPPTGRYTADANFGVLMKFDQAHGLEIESACPFNTVWATQWLSGENGASNIRTNFLKNLRVTGDRRRNIPGDCQAGLYINDDSVSEQPEIAIVNTYFNGDVSDCEWSVKGSVKNIRINKNTRGWLPRIRQGNIRTLNIKNDIEANCEIQIGGSVFILRAGKFSGYMTIDENIHSAIIKQLRGDIAVMGNVRIVRIYEPIAVSAPDPEEPIGILSVEGKAIASSPTGTIRFTADAVYTSEPNMYRLEDLRRYDSGDSWEYASTYKIWNSTGYETGAYYSAVETFDEDISGIEGYRAESWDGFGRLSYTAWHNDSNGTHLAYWFSEIPLGELELTMQDVSIPPSEYITPRKTYRDSGTFYDGTWFIEYTDRRGESQSIYVTEIEGEVKTSCRLVCQEQIIVPTGIYIAAKVHIVITMSGSALVTVNDSDEQPGKFTCRQNQVFWAVPEIGIIKAVTNTNYRIRTKGKTAYFKIIQADELTEGGI